MWAEARQVMRRWVRTGEGNRWRIGGRRPFTKIIAACADIAPSMRGHADVLREQQRVRQQRKRRNSAAPQPAVASPLWEKRPRRAAPFPEERRCVYLKGPHQGLINNK